MPSPRTAARRPALITLQAGLPDDPDRAPADREVDQQAAPRGPGLLQLITEDLRAHGGRWGAQGFWALAVHRFGAWRYGIASPWLRKPLSALYHVAYKLVQILTGIELPCEARVGRGVVIDHFGGIVVSGYAVIGDGCRLRNGVTIGLARVEEPCAPRLGSCVDIGAGAKLLGNITIGEHSVIGANAVVVRDVPPHHCAVGIPARASPRRSSRAGESS